jgi:hypothetical protein
MVRSIPGGEQKATPTEAVGRRRQEDETNLLYTMTLLGWQSAHKSLAIPLKCLKSFNSATLNGAMWLLAAVLNDEG